MLEGKLLQIQGTMLHGGFLSTHFPTHKSTNFYYKTHMKAKTVETLDYVYHELGWTCQ